MGAAGSAHAAPAKEESSEFSFKGSTIEENVTPEVDEARNFLPEMSQNSQFS